ncbi:uncharacterized protein LOC128768528 [Synchiropus splendidus]|uniref:uncharacterized protein LOC128768528 n=1 Tax=Synchiropus splendidus TaxID=270530 RepID=UPI00237E8FF3|nr:uncharacterized protein LOC128768528 [Synchiropus splendidus]
MAKNKITLQSPWKEGAVGFILGSVGGCILGATEDPVDRTLALMTTAGPLKPVIEEVQTLGALGLGTLTGATALTIAMTSVVAGVILAAVVASIFVVTRSCGLNHSDSTGLWVTAGLAGALGTTLSGATLGIIIEFIVNSSGMVGLLWALCIFTAVKPPLHFVFKLLWKQSEVCCTLPPTAWTMKKEALENTETQHRIRVTMQLEQRILTLENGGNVSEVEDRLAWTNDQQEREHLVKRKMEAEEAEMEQRTIQDWINTVVVKHVDFLAFAGVPMTVVAAVTACFGAFGYGNHQFVFLALLSLVTVISYFLLKPSDFKFWMLVGCMSMIATFVIAMLTLHAGQVVVTAAMKMHAAGHKQSKEDIGARMAHQSSLEALNTAFFVAKVCQLALGATVGGPLVRQAAGQAKVIVGSALVAGGLLAGVEVLTPVLGNGGRAGALLGVVGAAGVSVGAVAAMAGQWSSWHGTFCSVVGLLLGAILLGKFHLVNIGLQVPVGCIFAMTNPF